MASLLARLGSFSARRAWLVIIGWIVILGAAGGSFALFGGSLAQSFSIPGTETQRVTDALADELPDAKGATGSTVFQTSDGAAFTDEQKSAIGTLLSDIAKLDGVTATVNPFTTEQQRADQQQKLSDGKTQLEQGQEQLDASQQQLDQGQAQLTAGQQKLDQARAQAEAAGAPAAALAQLNAQQSQLDAEKAKITAGQQQIDEGRAKLETNKKTIDDGEKLLQYAAKLQTVSSDGTTAVATIAFENDLFTLAPETKEAVASALDAADIAGVEVNYSSTIATSLNGILGAGEIIGVVIALIVLIVMMRALLPALTPLISSLVGVGVGVTGSLAFSGVVDMASVTPVLGVMLGLAVGIDYSLFILNRHRKQLVQGMDARASIALANGTAGNAVVFAGSTVIVALVALLVTGIPFLSVMGIVGAACVLVAVLVSVTLTPAILGLLGTRALGRRARATIGTEAHAPKPLRRLNTWGAVATVIATSALLLVIAIPALSMRLGLPDGGSEATDTTQYKAYKAVENAFGAGQNGPILVVAELPNPVSQDDEVAEQAAIAGVLMEQNDVAAVAPVAVSDNRTIIAFQVIPNGGPSSESTELLVGDLRALSPVSVSGIDGEVSLGVAGQASGNIDVSQKLADALPIYLAVVVGLSLIILIVVFRSLLVPLIATAGYVLSLFAALGGITAIYQWGWLSAVFGVHDPGPVLSFAPILIMGVLFGLAMDYQLFLVSGMREAYAHGTPAREAVVAGRRNGRAVVTAAAIIMMSVFGGFIFSHLSMIRPIGFGLAFGVLFDAFIVRMLLVPALMHLVGKAAWWLPRWLDRIIPDVDVEGAKLERTHSVH